MKSEKAITPETVNQNLLNVQYAVRGPIVERAAQIERELEKGIEKPFERVVRANIGDCHALGQKPNTFIRQVLAAVSCPELVAGAGVPADVAHRAGELLADCAKGSVGSYSPSTGLQLVRGSVASYLSARDGVPACPEDVLLGAGASDLIKAVLTLLAQPADGKPPAVMIPIPQYPLFSGTLAELGVAQAPYYLDEEDGWALSVEELRRSWRAHSQHSCVRALVVINPGNPTGQVLSRENIAEVIKFAFDHKLFLMADEVYQQNIVSKPFHSFKKVMYEMGTPYSSMELASFATCSKGWAAECGLRAGFAELINLHPRVLTALRAARAVMQCPSVLGQCVLDCVTRPPAPGQPSHRGFVRELSAARRALRRRARLAHAAFNAIPGYSCNHIEGSMFAFPRVHVPERARRAAAAAGLLPDEFYCLQLLERTGICVVPGAGFGQRAGTYHFRTTILHPADEFQHMVDSIKRFHLQFLEEYTS